MASRSGSPQSRRKRRPYARLRRMVPKEPAPIGCDCRVFGLRQNLSCSSASRTRTKPLYPRRSAIVFGAEIGRSLARQRSGNLFRFSACMDKLLFVAKFEQVLRLPHVTTMTSSSQGGLAAHSLLPRAFISAVFLLLAVSNRHSKQGVPQ